MPVLIKLPDRTTTDDPSADAPQQRPGSIAERLKGSRIGRWTRRGAELFRAAADAVPVSWMGAAVAGLSSLALWRWGYGQMDLLIFVFGLSGLALLGLALLFTVIATVTVRRHVARRPELQLGPTGRIETGVPTETGFKLPALSRLPLVQLRWHFNEPAGLQCRRRVRDGYLHEEVVARRRCRVDGARRTVEVRDAFGLTRTAFARSLTSPLTVLPQIGRLGAMPPLFSMSSAEGLPYPSGAPEGDRMDIRRYVPGDPVRHILWKAYARTRQLNVRVPERSVDRSRRLVAYLAAGGDDEAAAAAARVALETGMLGQDWIFGADDAAEPTDDAETALLAIARSGNRPGARPGRDLAAFLAHPSVAGGLGVHCVIFAQAAPGTWADGLLAAASTFPGSVSFVLGTDGVLDDAGRPWWHRLLFRPEGDRASSATLRDLKTLTTRFATAGHSVRVVDRSTGRVYQGPDGGADAAALWGGAA